MRKAFMGRVVTAVLLVLAMTGAGALGGKVPHAVGADGAMLYVTPDVGQYVGAGVVFGVQVRLRTGDDMINAVQAYLTFPTDKLEVVGLPATAGSFLEYWMPEAMVNPGLGTVHIAAALPSGFDGGFAGDGLVVTITFRTKANVGSAPVTFDMANCFVLRSTDNTNVLSAAAGGSYTVVDQTPGSLSMTGAMRVSGQRLEVEYALFSDSVRIPVTSASVQSLTRSLPAGGSEAVTLDEASGDIWVDVLQANGTYGYTALMKPSGGLAVSYVANLDWHPQTVSFGPGGVWTKRAGIMYIPYSCGLDLSATSAIGHFDVSGANPSLDAIPSTSDLLFPISSPGGQYRFAVIMGGTLAFATLTQPRTGDLNHDGVINIADLSALLGSWGPAQANTEADVNMDLTVNIVDVSVLLSRWTPVG